MPPKKTHHNKVHFRLIEKIASMSYIQLFTLWASLAVIFAAGYFLLGTIGDVAHHGPQALVAIDDPLMRFFNALYYSIITATSTGYGDITPQGFSKALASIQSISALLVFAVFVTKLVSHHQEIALRQVHRMTFEDVFHNIREGLFIMRQDFDQLIEKAQKEGKLDEEDWMTLTIAYKTGKSLIQEIPDFYDQENDLYTLDDTREQLLQEAVHRTLRRTNEMLDAFSKHDIPWTQRDKSMQELMKFLQTVDTVTPMWHNRSPYNRDAAFEDILHVKENVAARLEKAL